MPQTGPHTGTTHIQDKTHTTYVLPTKLPSSLSGRHKCPLSRTTCHTRLLLTERATPTFGHGLANRSRQSRLFQSKSLKSMPKSRWLRIRYGARSVQAEMRKQSHCETILTQKLCMLTSPM